MSESLIAESSIDEDFILLSIEEKNKPDGPASLTAPKPAKQVVASPPVTSDLSLSWGERISARRDTDAAYFTSLSPAIYSELSSSHTLKRVRQELSAAEDKFPQVGIYPIGGNFASCVGSFEGPVGTPYEGGLFYILIIFPNRYPFEAPHINFLTKVYHPNIDREGDIWVDMLRTAWCPALTTPNVLLSLASLLSDPNFERALVPEVAVQYCDDRGMYEEIAKLYATRYANGQLPTQEQIEEHYRTMSKTWQEHVPVSWEDENEDKYLE